jgi:tetratricopeptide (TPR) repeat protein
MRLIATAIGLALVLTGSVVRADSVGDVRTGNAAFGDGRYEAAIEAFSRAVLAGDLDPEALAITFNNRGVAYSELGDYDRAIADYGQALKLVPGDPTAIKNLRIAHIRRAGAAARLGEQDAALADYTRAIELEPDHPLAYMRRGQLRLDRGDAAAAVADLTRAQELDPKNNDVATLLAEAQRLTTASASAAPAPAPTPAPPSADYSIDPPAGTPAKPSAGTPQATALVPAGATKLEQTPAPGAGPAPTTGEGRLYRAVADVNLRQGPGNDFPRIGAIARGTVVRVDGEDKGWLRLRLQGGGYGFVYKTWLAEAAGDTPSAPTP